MPQPSFTIRLAGASDAAELARLRFEFRTAIKKPAEAQAAFRARCERWMKDRLERSQPWRCWVAEESARIVGTIWLQVFEKVPNPVAEPETYGYVTNLYVVPELRGSGAGGALLDAAIAHCADRGVDTVLLWPTPKSRSLYIRHGFVETDDILGLYLHR
jgi:GNAT superfamily N-acetyltransferase